MTWVWRFSDGSYYAHGQPFEHATPLGRYVRMALRAAEGAKIGPVPGVLAYDPEDVRHVHHVIAKAVQGLGSITSSPPGAERPIDWPVRDSVPGRIY